MLTQNYTLSVIIIAISDLCNHPSMLAIRTAFLLFTIYAPSKQKRIKDQPTKPAIICGADCCCCLEEKVSVKFDTCAHAITCETCSNQVKVCPFCRKLIKRRIGLSEEELLKVACLTLTKFQTWAIMNAKKISVYYSTITNLESSAFGGRLISYILDWILEQNFLRTYAIIILMMVFGHYKMKANYASIELVGFIRNDVKIFRYSPCFEEPNNQKIDIHMSMLIFEGLHGFILFMAIILFCSNRYFLSAYILYHLFQFVIFFWREPGARMLQQFMHATCISNFQD